MLIAAMSLKKTEQDRLHSRQLSFIPPDRPTERLRVTSVVSSKEARNRKFRIDQFMAVPESSSVHHAFSGSEFPGTRFDDGSTQEDLSIWRHSDGTEVGNGSVRVETRLYDRRVTALIQPDQPTGPVLK